MNIDRTVLREGPVSIPAVILKQAHPRGQILVVHGYGGCKEEALGFAWRIGEHGFDVVAIDLRGHGENPRLYDCEILEDVEVAVRQRQAAGKVVAIGHSLGGRLCLLSGADYKIGISPALARSHSPETRKLITAMRSHRVRETHAGVNFDTVESLPAWTEGDKDRALLVYCTHDVPEVAAVCAQMDAKGVQVERVEDARHGDIFLNERTIAVVVKQLEEWFR